MSQLSEHSRVWPRTSGTCCHCLCVSDLNTSSVVGSAHLPERSVALLHGPACIMVLPALQLAGCSLMCVNRELLILLLVKEY
jgi:hypothetical protein